MQECVYEEYAFGNTIRFRIIKKSNFYEVIIEKYYTETDCMGYLEPAGFRKIHDREVYHVDSINTGIEVARELVRNEERK